MSHNKIDLSLYFATDPVLLGNRDILQVVEEAIVNGVTVVQLRNKTCTAAELYEQAVKLLEITRKYAVPLIINDRLDVMLAVDAEGVHLGPHDLPAAKARQLAPGKIIGCSVNNCQDLQRAKTAGADYIGIGPVFGTTTKKDARTALGVEEIRRLANATELPSVAIGGINLERVPDLIGTGVSGVCVISALLKEEDVCNAARNLKKRIAELSLPKKN